MTHRTTLQTQLLEGPVLQMTDIETDHAQVAIETAKAARAAIASANQHLIKGTTGTYGLIDVVRFKFRAFVSCFITLDSKESNQLQFYQYFQELKSALKTPSKKIKETYDHLVSIVRSQGHESALLDILNEELSEEVTTALIQQIRLEEGSEFNDSLIGIMQRFDAHTTIAVANKYGTKEEVEAAFYQVAAHREKNDEEMARFLAEMENKIKGFAPERFASETNETLKNLCDQLYALMLGEEKITPELLKGIKDNGISLIEGLSDPETFAESLEQIRLKHHGLRVESMKRQEIHRQLPESNQRLKKCEGAMLAKQAEVEALRHYKFTDISEFVENGIDRKVVEKELGDNQAQQLILQEDLKVKRAFLDQAIANDRLLKRVPTGTQLMKKTDVFTDIKLKYNLANVASKMTKLKNCYLALKELSKILKPPSFFQAKEFDQLLDEIKKEVPPEFNVLQDLKDFIQLDQEISEIKAELKAVKDLDTPATRAEIAQIPDLQASITKRESQLQELNIEIEKGKLLLRLIQNKELKKLNQDLEVLARSDALIPFIPQIQARIEARKTTLKALQNAYPKELVSLFEQLLALEISKKSPQYEGKELKEARSLMAEMEKMCPNSIPLYTQFANLNKEITLDEKKLAEVANPQALRTSIEETKRQIHELTLELEKGRSVLQLIPLQNKEKLEKLKQDLEAEKLSYNRAFEKGQLLHWLPQIQQRLEARKKELEDLKNAQPKELVVLLTQLLAKDMRSPNTPLSDVDLIRIFPFLDEMHKICPNTDGVALYDRFHALNKDISRLEKDLAKSKAHDNPLDRAEAATAGALKASIEEKERQISVLTNQSPTDYQISDQVLLRLPISAGVNTPVARAEARMKELKVAQEDFMKAGEKYRAALSAYQALSELPPVENQAMPLRVTEAGLVAEASIQDFATEIAKNVASQTTKKHNLKSLEIAYRICKVRASEEVEAFEKSVSEMDPILRRAFGSRLDPNALKPNAYQLQMKTCENLTQRLASV